MQPKNPKANDKPQLQTLPSSLSLMSPTPLPPHPYPHTLPPHPYPTRLQPMVYHIQDASALAVADHAAWARRRNGAGCQQRRRTCSSRSSSLPTPAPPPTPPPYPSPAAISPHPALLSPPRPLTRVHLLDKGLLVAQQRHSGAVCLDGLQREGGGEVNSNGRGMRAASQWHGMSGWPAVGEQGSVE